MAALWSGGVMWEREDMMRLPIPSCLGMKVRGLVV